MQPSERDQIYSEILWFNGNEGGELKKNREILWKNQEGTGSVAKFGLKTNLISKISPE